MASLSPVNWAVQKLLKFYSFTCFGLATLVVYPTVAWSLAREIGVVKYFKIFWEDYVYIMFICYLSDRVWKLYDLYIYTHIHNVLVHIGHTFVVDMSLAFLSPFPLD